MTRRYTVTLGNVEHRPGHRHDCAQAELELVVEADDKEAALAAVRELASKGAFRTALVLSGTQLDDFGVESVRVTLNPDTLGARSVRVTEQP